MGLFSAKGADASDLEGLVKRVSRATGHDRALDSDIWAAVGRSAPQLSAAADAKLPAVTGSLDEALALGESLLPDWSWKLNQVDKGAKHYKCTFEPRKGSPARGFHEKTPALAVVDAVLRALIDQKSGSA